jgi:hypothetical protein
MANEVTFSVSLKATKNNATVNQTANLTADMTGTQMTQATQNIGTTAELVDFGDITGAPQFVLIRNLDATNFVEVGGDSGLTVFKIKIPAGKANLVSPSAVPLYAKANAAPVNIQLTAVES